jgi:hypothetical protein
LALFALAADFELTLAILFDERTAATLALAVSYFGEVGEVGFG